MYKLDQNVSEQSGGNFFNVGIQENVSLTEITLEEASNGNQYLKFHFEGENGEKLSHTEWPLAPDDQNFEKKLKNFLIRIKHISTKFVSAESVDINAPDFETFANKLIALLTPHLRNTKVRIKLVYNYRNYVSIPKYVPFIETMAVAKSASRLKIDASFDKMEKDEGTDPVLSTATETLVSPTSVTTEDTDEVLPF